MPKKKKEEEPVVEETVIEETAGSDDAVELMMTEDQPVEELVSADETMVTPEEPPEEAVEEATEELVEESVEEPEEVVPFGKGDYWIKCDVLGRSFRCEGEQVEGQVKKLRYLLPLSGQIVVSRLE